MVGRPNPWTHISVKEVNGEWFVKQQFFTIKAEDREAAEQIRAIIEQAHFDGMRSARDTIIDSIASMLPYTDD